MHDQVYSSRSLCTAKTVRYKASVTLVTNATSMARAKVRVMTRIMTRVRVMIMIMVQLGL